MLRGLTDTQIEDLLKGQVVGRIGCHSPEMMYIVPVNYVYEDGNIFLPFCRRIEN